LLREGQNRLRYAIENKGVICCSEIQAKDFYPNRTSIIERLSTAETAGYLEICNRMDNQDNLTDEEFSRYKKVGRGRVPLVWRVTEKGREKCA
jgi:hypothetical protein